MIDRIHHVGIVVRDVDKALGFYRDLMGLDVTADEVVADEGVRRASLALGENEIELVQPTRDDTGVARFLGSRGESLHHICLSTGDIAAELARVKREGFELIDEAPRGGLAMDVAFVHPSAMHGVLVEFAQPPPGARVSPEKGFDHLAVTVRDFDEGAGSWKRLTGLEVANVLELPGMRLGQLPCGQCTIELLSPTRADSPIAKRLQDQGERASSMIAIEVDDIEAEVARYRVAGLTLDDPTPGVLPNSVRTVISPDQAFGVSVQLIAFRE